MSVDHPFEMEVDFFGFEFVEELTGEVAAEHLDGGMEAVGGGFEVCFEA